MTNIPKSIIKKLLREELNDLTFDHNFFMKRIPFLKEYKFFKDERNPNRLFFQRVIFHENVTKKIGDDLVTFKQLNISSEFTFYVQRINDNKFYNFILKNEFHPMIDDNMFDDLTKRVLFIGLKQINEKLSINYDLSKEELTETKLDEIINNINGSLFKIEHVSDKNNTPLF